MAVIAIVAGGIIGLIHGLIALALGLAPATAALVWVLTGALFALLIFRELYLAGGDARMETQADAVRDDLLAMGEVEIRRAALTTTDATSMSRLVRIYAERDALLASARENRRVDP